MLDETATLCQGDGMTESRQLLSAAQVADILGKSARTIQRMAETGELRAEKMPGQTGAYLFERADVEKLRDEMAKAS